MRLVSITRQVFKPRGAVFNLSGRRRACVAALLAWFALLGAWDLASRTDDLVPCTNCSTGVYTAGVIEFAGDRP